MTMGVGGRGVGDAGMGVGDAGMGVGDGGIGVGDGGIGVGDGGMGVGDGGMGVAEAEGVAATVRDGMTDGVAASVGGTEGVVVAVGKRVLLGCDDGIVMGVREAEAAGVGRRRNRPRPVATMTIRTISRLTSTSQRTMVRLSRKRFMVLSPARRSDCLHTTPIIIIKDRTVDCHTEMYPTLSLVIRICGPHGTVAARQTLAEGQAAWGPAQAIMRRAGAAHLHKAAPKLVVKAIRTRKRRGS